MSISGLSNNSLNRDLKELYKSGKFSDIILQARDIKFPAHKAIVATRSEVFDTMFQPNIKESNVVQLYIEPAILSNMLQYIYTGIIDDFNIDKAMSLYPVADKYLLHELKDWCVDIMLDNLRMQNVCKIAILADLHPNPKLKRATLSIFRNNAGDIFKKKEWLDLVQDPDRHALVSDILQAVSQDFTTNCSKLK